MMKGCAMEQSSTYAACEEMIMMMGSVSVVCPKPRRLGLFNNDHIPPRRWHMHHDDSKDGSELLDIILAKGSERSGHQVASSPPYFCGSPPSRASNPVIQDAQFGNEKVTPFSRAPSPARKPAGGGGGGGGGGAGGVRMMKFGSKPAAVRIEGFDCLGRDGQSRSISAVA
ncbi:uncharacterized protein LOC100262793 isoform X2 [Vitis vinifera]|nr:uncharacterized protein LOC100262793 isoform X2 [Vitis vinifera]|eukprot:XP_010663598.1 PREDICTED: uncharacterized protein LOC100262793 [Vitis vinifera]